MDNSETDTVSTWRRTTIKNKRHNTENQNDGAQDPIKTGGGGERRCSLRVSSLVKIYQQN
jgi:hypothetical protein